MKESFDLAIQELKRVDHLFWVSLKYTRTVDVIKHVIDRLISCIGYGMESILKYGKEKKLVATIPENAGLRAELLKKTFSDNPELLDYINFYQRLRKLSKAGYSKREEFRRHVTMIATIDKGEVVEVSIDSLKEDYEKTKVFIRLVKKIINEEKDEDQ
jgi:replicative superfamily II helicase